MRNFLVEMQPKPQQFILKPHPLAQWQTLLERAIAQPDEADLAQFWQMAEFWLAGLSREEKLRAAGEAIALLAELHHARAQYLLGNWDKRWKDRSDDEPVLTDDMLSSFLRQTMSLNLDELLEDIAHTRNREPQESIAAEVEKQAVLDWLEQDEKEKALAVAHDENVSEWVAMIQAWLEAHQQQGTFRAIATDLQRLDSHLTPVAVWLALLLGGFQIHAGEEFYCSDFLVAAK